MGKIRWNIDTVIVVVIVGIAIIISMCLDYNDKKDREADPDMAIGIITRLTTLGNVNYFDYAFKVDTVEYNGNAHYSPSKNKFVVGDTIFVIFQRSNPKNCEVMQR